MKRTTGFFVAFDYSEDALEEISAFFKRSGIMIRALTVKDILEEQIARKLVWPSAVCGWKESPEGGCVLRSGGRQGCRVGPCGLDGGQGG